jgi:hypothetical protein
MGGLGGAEGQPRHYSPDVGGSVILEADHRPKRMEEPTSTVVCSPISHQKLSSFFGATTAAVGGFTLFALLVYVVSGEKVTIITGVIAAWTTGATLASKGWSEPKSRRKPCGSSSPVS